MAKFDIKTVKPKFVVTTSPENKIDVVVNKPIIETKLSKSFFKLKNTGGPAGQPGRDGQDGQSATIEVASTTTLPAGSSATVENVGTVSAARLAFGIPKGDTGAAGADGDAATIQIGQVETLQPNQQCYVENVGSSTAAIFNIGIPKGEKGDSGSGSGDMTASVYDPNGTVAAAGGIPDYVDSNGGKIDTIEVNGTPQAITNKTVDIAVPTDTTDLTNGAGYITSSALPTVNDATLTIQHNGTNVQTFTANQGTSATANIETIWADDIAPATQVPPVTGSMIDWSTVAIETGRSELLTIPNNGSVDKTFTFTKPFTTPPVVMVTMRGDASWVEPTGELLAVVTDNITTTGFTARLFNPYSGTAAARKMYVDYIAIGV